MKSLALVLVFINWLVNCSLTVIYVYINILAIFINPVTFSQPLLVSAEHLLLSRVPSYIHVSAVACFVFVFFPCDSLSLRIARASIDGK